MTMLLHHRPTGVVPTPPKGHPAVGDLLWRLACVLAVALPVASIAAAALTGSSLWLIPAALVAGVVAVVLSVCT